MPNTPTPPSDQQPNHPTHSLQRDAGDVFGVHPFAGQDRLPRVAGPSRSEHDALAELFLSEAVLAPTGTTGNGSVAGRVERVAWSNNVGQSRGVDVGNGMSLEHALDGLAGTRRPAAPPIVDDGVRCELVVLGHLPGLASAWIVQYARHVADSRTCTVGLLRLQGDQTWIDLVPPAGKTIAQPTNGAIFDAAGSGAQAALGAAKREAGRWIVRAEEQNAVDLSTLPNDVCVTVLSGADEAAIVNSYKLLKRFAGELGEVGTRLRLVILDADRSRASDAVERIRQTVASHVGKGIVLQPLVAKMGPTGSVSMYRGKTRFGVLDALSELNERESDSISGAVELEPEPMREPVKNVGRRDLPSLTELVRDAFGTDEEAEAASIGAIAGEEPQREVSREELAAALGLSEEDDGDAALLQAIRETELDASVEEPVEETVPTAKEEPVAQAAWDPVSLIDGLRPLGMACPYATGVLLAMDGSGAMHLVVSTVAGRGGIAVGDASGQLLTAASWAVDHASILKMAVKNLVIGTPMLHVIVDDLKPARGLLDTGIRVHLAVTVSVAGREVTVAKALN